MAQAYYNVEKAAEVLGVSGEEVKKMRERQELYGYRDGATWKFKAEDVDRLAAQRAGNLDDSGDQGDVLLSDQELGSSAGASGSVIGSGIEARRGRGDTGIGRGSKSGGKDEATDDYDLVLDGSGKLPGKPEDVAPPKSAAKGKAPGKSKPPATPAGDSALDLSSRDDDLVLGGSSGGGSDVTIGGDSGISLVDPADSGLSLEQPLELGGGADESLELGEEDMLGTVEDPAAKSPSDLKTDDDFLLTPLPEGADEEDSSSGSQVIALDTEGTANEAATMIGGPATASMVAMLDEDLSTSAPLGTLAAEAVTPGLISDHALPGPSAADLAAYAALPETPYSGWNIAALTLCVLVLAFCGSMVFDLVRNMWSWDQAWNVNSSTMDWLIGLFEKK